MRIFFLEFSTRTHKFLLGIDSEKIGLNAGYQNLLFIKTIYNQIWYVNEINTVIRISVQVCI